MRVEWDVKERDLNDGFGLCSPLRVHPNHRLSMLFKEASVFSTKLAGIIDEEGAFSRSGEVSDGPGVGEIPEATLH